MENGIISVYSWPGSVIAITAMFVVIMLGAALAIFFVKLPRKLRFIRWVISVPLLAILLYTCKDAPRYSYVDGDSVGVKRLIGRVDIPLESVASATPVHSGMLSGSIRTFGSGGAFGYLGHFRNDALGEYEMYITENKNMLLIEQKDGRKIIFNFDDPEEAAKFINDRTGAE